MGSKQKQLVNLELHSDVCLPLLRDDREAESGRKGQSARDQGYFSLIPIRYCEFL